MFRWFVVNYRILVTLSHPYNLTEYERALSLYERFLYLVEGGERLAGKVNIVGYSSGTMRFLKKT